MSVQQCRAVVGATIIQGHKEHQQRRNEVGDQPGKTVKHSAVAAFHKSLRALTSYNGTKTG